MFTREFPAVSGDMLMESWTLPSALSPVTLMRSGTNFLATYVKSGSSTEQIQGPAGFHFHSVVRCHQLTPRPESLVALYPGYTA